MSKAMGESLVDHEAQRNALHEKFAQLGLQRTWQLKASQLVIGVSR